MTYLQIIEIISLETTGSERRGRIVRLTSRSPEKILRKGRQMGSNKKVVGIDLAGSEKRPTGICILEGSQARVSVVHTDEEIFQAVGEDAQAVAIDAPLSLPYGRCCLKDDCRCAGQAHFRVCDLELRKMKIKFFPITLGPMRKLTLRGMD